MDPTTQTGNVPGSLAELCFWHSINQWTDLGSASSNSSLVLGKLKNILCETRQSVATKGLLGWELLLLGVTGVGIGGRGTHAAITLVA